MTDTDWASFGLQGFLRLGQVLAPDELAALESRVDDVMLGRADLDYGELLMELDSGPEGFSPGFKGPSLEYRRIEGLEADPLVRAYVQKEMFRELCGRTYGSSTPIAIFRAMLVNKPPFGGTAIHWHQDYWSYLDRLPLLTTWLALDYAGEHSGSLRVVAGSHRLGHLNPDDVSGFLTTEMVERHCGDGAAVTLALEPGDLVLLHNGLLHASDLNHSARRRRALSVCYVDAATRDARNGRRFPPVTWTAG